MMTDKKFDKIMKDATDILNKMPEAHNFAHGGVHDQIREGTIWFMDDSKMKELKEPDIHPWAAPNPVEKFVMDSEHIINALVKALKEMADDYDSLEQQYNEYKAMQPSETAKELYDHVNGRGIQLIDILVDHDKAHLKVENQKIVNKPREIPGTTAHQPEGTPRTAHWIEEIEEEDGGYYCSACHWHTNLYYAECPCCHAKMETVL